MESGIAGITLPEDDSSWPTTGENPLVGSSSGVCLSPLPYTALNAPSNTFHLAGRYYSAGSGTPTFTSSPAPTLFGLRVYWAFVDEDGNGIWWNQTDYINSSEESPFNLRVYKYDATSGDPTNELNHTLIFSEDESNVVPAYTRGGKLLLFDPPRVYDQGTTRVVLVDIATQAVDWDVNVKADLLLADNILKDHEAAPSNPAPFKIANPVIGEDGHVYFIRQNPNGMSSGPLGPPYYLETTLGMFFKLDSGSGVVTGGYGVHAGVSGNKYGVRNTLQKSIICTGFDVDASGNVLLTLGTLDGWTILELTPDSGEHEEHIDGYVALNYTEGWEVSDGLGDAETGVYRFVELRDANGDPIGTGYWMTIPGRPRTPVYSNGSTAAAAYYLATNETDQRGCIRWCSETEYLIGSVPWASSSTDEGYTIPRLPDIMIRAANGEIHTSTGGTFVQEPTYSECEDSSSSSTVTDVQTQCCESDRTPTNLVAELDFEHADLSSPILLNLGYSGEGDPGWSGQHDFEGCDAPEPGFESIPSWNLDVECIENPDSLGTYIWRIVLSYGSSSQTNLVVATSCSPFLLETSFGETPFCRTTSDGSTVVGSILVAITA